MKPFHQAACQTQNFKSHFVSNIIFILGEWWGEESGATMWREGGCRQDGVSEDCYSKDKRSHQSKLKKRALGLEWDSVQAGTHVCMRAHLRKCPHAVGLTAKVSAGWMGGVASGLQLNFSPSGVLSQQHFHISASITAHSITPPQTHKMPVNVILFDSQDNK